MSRILIVFGLFFSFSTSFSQELHPLIDYDHQEEQMQWVESTYASMTLEEKVGQLFMVDLFSSDPPSKIDRVKNLVTNYHIGGVIFSKGGPVRQAHINNQLQDLAKTKLLIAMDAEWGLAMRLDSTYAFPWNMTLGAIEDASLIYEVGKRIGQHNKRMGVHINFAPVLDINTNPLNPIIGNRSFGEDRDNVTLKAMAFMQGMQSEGVLANGKHFPGHGDTDTDSHKTLPTVLFSEIHIDTVELHPYKKLFSRGLASVMIAHLNIPALEPRNMPVSLSERVVTELLQEKLGFQGLVFTDALNMKGAADYKNPGEVDLAAFLAGNDILLISEDVPKAHQLIIENYQKGTITEERLAHSVKKILMAKYKVGLHAYQPVNTQYLYQDLNSVKEDALYEKLLENAVTVVKNTDQTVPIKTLENKKFAYVHFGDDSGDAFFNQLNKYTQVDQVKGASLDELIKKLETYDQVIIGFHKSNENPWKGFKFTQKELTWIYEIARTNRVILTVFARPYALMDLKTTTHFESIVIGYQNSKIAQEVTAQILFGAREAKGKLPVSAGADFPVNTQILTHLLGRLTYGVPETVGMNSQKLKKVDSLAQEVIRRKMAPGLQISISKSGKVVYQKSFGHHTYEKNISVENHHVYDLASLTKILAATPVLMKMKDEGHLSLKSTLGDLLPEYQGTDKANISVQAMFSHYAKFRSWIPFYKQTLDSITKKLDSRYYSTEYSASFPLRVSKGIWANTEIEDFVFQTIKDSKLNKDLKYLYSDLPFYLVKKIAENQYEIPFDQLIQQSLFDPLGANLIGFNPTRKFGLDQIPPTEMDLSFRGEIVHGYVHDQGAAMLGGVSGHAGLFSNANDVNKIMQLFIQRGFYGGQRYFDPETLDTFNTCYYCHRNVRRGVGFDKPQLGKSGPTCGCTSQSSFGHSGFTGTFTWADPENEIVYVFLSNRTFPDAENRLMISSNIRSDIQQAIYDAVDW